MQAAHNADYEFVKWQTVSGRKTRIRTNYVVNATFAQPEKKAW